MGVLFEILKKAIRLSNKRLLVNFIVVAVDATFLRLEVVLCF